MHDLERDVKQTVAVTDLVIASLRAQDLDRANICSGLAIIAAALAGSDPDARAMLCQTMRKLVRELELDPDLASVMSAKWN